MARGQLTYRAISTVSGGSMTIGTDTGTLFGGFTLIAGATGATLTVKDSATTLYVTSGAAGAYITVGPYATPIACKQIVVTCSNTVGSYVIFVAK
jgi:hypothetical protein